jgi:hypothetical protein
VLAWLRAAPGRLADLCRNRPVTVGLAGLSLLLATVLLTRRRARTRPEIRAYRRALRHARLELGPGETPRELLERARAAGLPPARFEALEAATRAHEAARYAA